MTAIEIHLALLSSEKVFVSSHGGTIRALRSIFEEWTLEEIGQKGHEMADNCAVIAYRYSQNENRLIPAECLPLSENEG